MAETGGKWKRGKPGRPPFKKGKTMRNRLVAVAMTRAEEKLLFDLTNWENNARTAQGVTGKPLDRQDIMRALLFKRAGECGLIDLTPETPPAEAPPPEEEEVDEDEPEEPEEDDTLAMLETEPEPPPAPPKPPEEPSPPEDPPG